MATLDGDPVIGMMYRPAALLYIGGLLSLMVIGVYGFVPIVAGVIWDEVHWRRKKVI